MGRAGLPYLLNSEVKVEIQVTNLDPPLRENPYTRINQCTMLSKGDILINI